MRPTFFIPAFIFAIVLLVLAERAHAYGGYPIGAFNMATTGNMLGIRQNDDGARWYCLKYHTKHHPARWPAWLFPAWNESYICDRWEQR